MVSFGDRLSPAYIAGWVAKVIIYHNVLKRIGVEETFIDTPGATTKAFIKERIQRVQKVCQPVFTRVAYVGSSFRHEPFRYPARQAYRPIAALGRRGRHALFLGILAGEKFKEAPIQFTKALFRAAKEEIKGLKGRVFPITAYVKRKADQGGHVWTYVDRSMETGQRISKLLKTALTIDGFKEFIGRIEAVVGKSVIHFDKIARWIPLVALPVLALSMAGSGAAAIKGVFWLDREMVVVNLLELKLKALDFGGNVVGFAQLIISVAGLQEVALLSQIGAPLGMAIAAVRITLEGWYVTQNLLFLRHLHKKVDPLFKGQRPHLKDHIGNFLGPDFETVSDELLNDPALSFEEVAAMGEALDVLGHLNYPPPNRDELREGLIEFLQESIALTPQEESKLQAQNERIYAKKKNKEGKEKSLERLKERTISRKRLRLARRGKGKTVKEMERMLTFLEAKRKEGVPLTEREVMQLEKGMQQVKNLVQRRILGSLIGITSSVISIVGFGLLYSGYGAIASLVLLVVSAALLLFQLFYDDFLVTLGLRFPTYGKKSLLHRLKERIKKLDEKLHAWFEKWKDYMPPPVYQKAMTIRTKLQSIIDKLHKVFVAQGVQRAAQAFRAKKTAFYGRLLRCKVIQVPFKIKVYFKNKFINLTS